MNNVSYESRWYRGLNAHPWLIIAKDERFLTLKYFKGENGGWII